MTPAEHMPSTVPAEVVEFTALLRSVSERLARFQYVSDREMERLAALKAHLFPEEET